MKRSAKTRRELEKSPRAAYTLVEVMISIFVLSLMTVSLYAGFFSGFEVVRLSRENLRATQILLQKLEAVRLYNWSEINSTNYLKPTFTDYYNPMGITNGSVAATYSGFITLSSLSNVVPGDYQNKMVGVTAKVFWTNYVQKPNATALVRSRQMQTYVARYGMQNYIYK
jgi:type II secretory pathway pseudopilin PulG